MVNNTKIKNTENIGMASVFHFTLFMIFILPVSVFSQYHVKDSKFVKKISVQDILNSDTLQILSHNYIKRTDSINALFIDDHYWFLFANQKRDKKYYYGKLCSFNAENHSLYILTDSIILDDPASIYDLNIFAESLFLKRYYNQDIDEGKVGGLQIDVIDSKIKNISKSIFLKEGYEFTKMYVRDNHLNIELEKIRAEFDIGHYILFWAPRGAPPKYIFHDTGEFIRVVFDRQFNLIKEENLF